MTLTRADTAESLFKVFGWPNREARDVVNLCVEEQRASRLVDDASNDLDQSEGWGLLSKRALTSRASLAVAGCGGSGRQQPALNPEPPRNEAPVYTSSTTATVNENQTAAYTAVATEPDGDALTHSLEGAVHPKTH